MKRFTATILEGHNGCACEVPFEPPSREVTGTLNGIPFESRIKPRMRKQWLLIDAELMEKAGVEAGDEVKIAIAAKPVKKASPQTIERVRKICLALPETTEKLSHGEPTWFANGRVFVAFSNNHHNDGNVAIVCNAPEGAQEALIAGDPKHFYYPPYVGGGGWIGIRLDTGLDWKVISSLISQARDATTSAQLRSRARSGSRGRGATARAR